MWRCFVFPGELEDDLANQDNSIVNSNENADVQPVESTTDEATVQTEEPTYEEATVQPVEPAYEEATVQPVKPIEDESYVNENPNAQVNLMKGEEEETHHVEDVSNEKITDNKSLMFVLVIGLVILVAIFVLPMLFILMKLYL